MPRSPDSGQLDLHEVFRRVQQGVLAGLTSVRSFEHGPAAGSAGEAVWLELFAQYLPKRFRAAPAFVINAQGRRSRQIDIAIFDHHFAAPLFPNAAGEHIPVESVYAVFEVKATLTRHWFRDAGMKTASVRALAPGRPIVAGILGATSCWKPDSFAEQAQSALGALPAVQALQFGCALEHGSFEKLRRYRVAPADQALIFFLLRLMHQLNRAPVAPRPNLLRYLSPPASTSRGR